MHEQMSRGRGSNGPKKLECRRGLEQHTDHEGWRKGREGAPGICQTCEEQQLCGQRGGREGTGGGARAWPFLCAPHLPGCARTGLPLISEAHPPAASIPRTLLCSGPVLCHAGAFPAARGSAVHPRHDIASCSYVPFQTPGPTPALVSSYLSWLLHFCLSCPLLNAGGHQKSAADCVLIRFEFLYFWYHGPFVSLPTPSF